MEKLLVQSVTMAGPKAWTVSEVRLHVLYPAQGSA